MFFDAPFESIAGPGVLPTFSDKEYRPYRTWLWRDEEGNWRSDGRPGDGKGEAGVERAVRLMEEEGDGGEWVACMGFSQGTRVVGGLLLEQMRRRELGMSGFADGKIGLRFGVLCNGGAEPLVTDPAYCECQSLSLRMEVLD